MKSFFKHSYHGNECKFTRYPFGKVTKRLQNAKKWIYNNLDYCVEEGKKLIWFDFPDYYGMPISISYKLSVDEVDYIQRNIDIWIEF